uniref:Galectin domain-containing protein n=1 Tax=Oryza barthii TaxID=65489 RepID=A0A0D3GEI0_9ORYZ
MKKWHGGFVIVSLFIILMLRYVILDSPLAEKSLQYVFQQNNTTPLHWLDVPNPPAVQNPQNISQVISTELLASNLSITRNFSDRELQSLHSWNHLKDLVSHAHILPDGVEAIKEAGVAWRELNAALEYDESAVSVNGSTHQKSKEKQCPYSIRRMNATRSGDRFVLKIPCGLIQGSSITIIGTPGGLLGSFKIELTGATVPGEPDPPIVLHYNVRLLGDKLTEDPVIVQNTWTIADDWGSEDRCPSPGSDAKDIAKVDELEKCGSMVGNDQKQAWATKLKSNVSSIQPAWKKNTEPKKYFPFRQGYLAIAILRVGAHGIHMTVDGKHVTSFAFREDLEPGFVGEVRIAGDIKLLSVIASGLPTTEDFEHVTDLEILKAPPVPMDKPLDLFIGIFSTANNFKRRMAVRRTWMQYDAVRSGKAAVRFFVGLLKFFLLDKRLVSQEWPEESYPPWAHGPGYIVSQDIAKEVYRKHKRGELKQLHAVTVVSANGTAIMEYSKLTSAGFCLYALGILKFDSYYPDVVLQMFKLEDVAMGIWINEMKKDGLDVKYENDGRILVEGCEEGYVVAHYQEPRDMMCLWDKFLKTKRGTCCKE